MLANPIGQLIIRTSLVKVVAENRRLNCRFETSESSMNPIERPLESRRGAIT